MSSGTPKPEAQPLFHEEVQAEMRVQPELEATLLRFWEMVRKSADVIVTLRQENASLQAKLQQARTVVEQPTEELQQLRDALTDSESHVHALREDLAALPTLRDEVDELRTLTVTMSAEIARLEKLESVIDELRTSEQDLVGKLTDAHAELEEMRRAIDRTEDQKRVTSDEVQVTSDEVRVTSETASQEEVAELTSQLMQMRVELESRTKALQELRVVMISEQHARQSASAESQADIEQVILEREALRARVDELDVVAQRYAEAQERISELEESHGELRAELERTMAVVNKYRAAGVAYLEDPSMEGQVPLFGMEARSTAVTPYMTEEEAKALADRIDLVAQKLAELL
jgi:chromosome segregation ATPase